MLTDAQRDFFDREGYLVVENVLSRQVLDSLHAEYAALLDDLYAGWQAEGRVPEPTGMGFWDKLLASYKAGCDWFQPMDCSLPGDTIYGDTPMYFGQAAFDMITHPNLLDLVEDLIGPEITSNPIQHIRIKPPQGDVHADEVRAHVTTTDWHQDRGVTHAEADQTTMITVWLAITDVDLDSAPLQVIPRRHREDLIPHCAMKQTGIPTALLPQADPVPLPVGAGGAVIFHPLTPHASMPNNSDHFRWSFDIRFNKTGEPTGRSHFPAFVARSRAHPETELRSADTWRKMWEDARARLATAPHIPIHRWDSTAPHCA